MIYVYYSNNPKICFAENREDAFKLSESNKAFSNEGNANEDIEKTNFPYFVGFDEDVKIFES